MNRLDDLIHDGLAGNPARSTLNAPSVWRSLIGFAWKRPDVLFASLVINILSLGLPIIILQIYDRVIPNTATETLTFLVLGLVCVVAFETVLRLIRHYLINWWAARFSHWLGSWGVAQLLASDLSSFDREATGTQLRRFSAIDVVREFYSGQSLMAVIDLPFACVFLALIGVIAGPLVAVPLAMLALAGLITALAGRRLGDALSASQDTDDRRYNFLIEVLRGIQTVKGLGMEVLMARRHERLQETSSYGACRTSRLTGMIQTAGEMLGQLSIVGVAALGSLMVVDGRISMGALAASILLAGRTMQPLINAIGAWKQFQSAVVGQTHLSDLAALTTEIRDGQRPLDRFDGTIELKNVSFHYGGEEKALLDGIDLRVERGETIAIQGGSGAGKTTLLLAIMGILREQSGAVRLDGEDRRALDPWSVRSYFAYLPTRGELFYGTILENLTAFQPERHFDEAMTLASELGLDEVFARLPDGLETRIDDDSANMIPSGVRQLIAVVRALLGEPRVILFDEANTALDSTDDKKLADLIGNRLSDRTTILVTHRPSLAKLATRWLELRDGKLHDLPTMGGALPEDPGAAHSGQAA